MKKMLIYASLIGIAGGAVYLLCKKEKSDKGVSKSDANKMALDSNINTTEEEPSSETNVVEEMYQAKCERAQSVHERHSEAAEIMSDAFKNIFSEIEPIVPEEKTENIVIDNESAAVMKELDSISDELDDLLK